MHWGNSVPESFHEQMDWLENGLRASTSDWQFVYGHYPPYSSWEWEDDITLLRRPFQDWGADAFFAGHRHNYERLVLDGFPYFVSGAGGVLLYDFDPAVPGSEVRYNDNYGAMRVTVDGSITTFEFLSIDDGASGANGGLLIDSYIVEKTQRQGDFNGDGDLDTADLNALTNEILLGTMNLRLDLNADETINYDDHRVWIKDLAHTWFGDSNLDGEFNSSDLVAVFEAGKYEQDVVARWSEGDWNGDGRFGTGDLVTAFEDGGYEQGKLAGASAVPEPASIFILIGGLIGIGFCHRCG